MSEIESKVKAIIVDKLGVDDHCPTLHHDLAKMDLRAEDRFPPDRLPRKLPREDNKNGIASY